MKLETILKRPKNISDKGIGKWFEMIADYLLNKTRLVLYQEEYRLTEVEFYYFDEVRHQDFFSHRDPLQRHLGKWYFLRHHGGYRAGTFKGLDLTFGQQGAFGGILIRGLEREDGSLIDGPSLCVDELLRVGGVEKIAELDGFVGAKRIWDPENPLHFVELPAWERREIFSSARVGLNLKKELSEKESAYITRDYRFLTEPRRIKKGRVQLIMALHLKGWGIEAIHELTGTPNRAILRYIRAFQEALDGKFLKDSLPSKLSSVDLARIHGLFPPNDLSSSLQNSSNS